MQHAGPTRLMRIISHLVAPLSGVSTWCSKALQDPTLCRILTDCTLNVESSSMSNQWEIGRDKDITPALIPQGDLVMIVRQLETTLPVFSYLKDARQVQLPRYIYILTGETCCGGSASAK
ncbi:hypothetical protein EDD15DRAFT_146346 [Pisolithus albus]|nr:hypothetical protein EDD15DRAFT_146346 [Pisolithus albus]